MPTSPEPALPPAVADGDRLASPPWVRRIHLSDVGVALRRGVDDFLALPTHSVPFGVFYAAAGLLLLAIAFDRALLPLIVPLVGGFALIGPFAAVGLYAASRRREADLDIRWRDLLDGYRAPASGAVFGLGLVLAVLLVTWMAAAAALTHLLLGPLPADLGAAAHALFATPAGWTLMAVGGAIGLAFGTFAFAISVIAFPLILDRQVDAITAANASRRAVAANPGPMAAWAGIVAGLLVLGALPAMLGLVVVLPILGHATWHLYRRVIVD